MDSDSDSNLNLNQTRLQRTLSKYSHLDLTSNIVPEVAIHQGGGGFSDVFQSVLDPSWQPRPDINVMALLLRLGAENSDTILQLDPEFPGLLPENSTVVAVKCLRFGGKLETKIEKVIHHLVSSSFKSIISVGNCKGTQNMG